MCRPFHARKLTSTIIHVLGVDFFFQKTRKYFENITARGLNIGM